MAVQNSNSYENWNTALYHRDNIAGFFNGIVSNEIPIVDIDI